MTPPPSRIRLQRLELCLTTQELASRCRVSRQVILDVETGARGAWPSLRRALSEVLDISEARLFDQVPA